MITITGRKMAIPPDERIIGFEGDNLVETRTFELSKLYENVDLSGFDFKLDTAIGETKNIIDLTKTVSADKISLSWTIEEDQLTQDGYMDIQVRAFQGTAEKWHSEADYVVVGASINAESYFPAVLPSEFTQMEQRVTALKNATDENATAAALSETNAAGSAGTAVEQAQAASINKDATDANVVTVEQDKQTVAADKETVAADKAEVLAAEQRVIALMSTDTRSYFFATLAERDAFVGFRNCDRCSVLETRADYIYDDHDVDGDAINPEWILTSQWDALKTVAWEIITGKPEFAAVATSGSYTDLSDKPNRYESFTTLADGNWDYSVSDKAVITLAADTAINITNVYNGAVGLIKVYGGYALILPENSKKSVDFDYVTASADQHYTYTFIFDGVNFCWSRSVCV